MKQTKKTDSPASENSKMPKPTESLKKGNGTNYSNQPQRGRNKDGKDGANPTPRIVDN